MEVEGGLPFELELDVLIDLPDLEVHALHPGQDVDEEGDAVKETFPQVVVPSSAGTLKRNESNC